MNQINFILFILLACTFFMSSCHVTPPKHEDPINECDTITIGKLDVSHSRSLVKLGDTLFLSASAPCCSRIDEADTFRFVPSGGTLFVYKMKRAQSKYEQNTTPAIASFTIYAVSGSVNKEPDCWMYADTGYCARLNRILRHFTPTNCFQNDTAKVCVAVIPHDTGTFAFSYSRGFRVASSHHDLYTPFGDTSKFSFCAEDRTSISWAPIDGRLYFFRVEL